METEVKYVKIPLKEYVELQNQSLELNYLESCGVDNWDTGISKNEWARECGENSWDDMLLSEEDCEYLIIK